uniref:Putative secreted protein n=1 Tax=Rhipicephalus microplus TaxID=6941 RepID=A0A6M2DBF3_RHIMP
MPLLFICLFCLCTLLGNAMKCLELLPSFQQFSAPLSGQITTLSPYCTRVTSAECTGQSLEMENTEFK